MRAANFDPLRTKRPPSRDIGFKGWPRLRIEFDRDCGAWFIVNTFLPVLQCAGCGHWYVIKGTCGVDCMSRKVR